MATVDLAPPQPRLDHSGENARWVVLACYIATIMLIVGAPGSVGAILLTGMATAFWWIGFGRDESHFEPVAIGNAVGIFSGLAFSFMQIGLPVAIVVIVILAAALHRARIQRQPWTALVPGILALVISLAGAAILGQILPNLPF
jgi:hypothetical protein